MKTMYQLLWHDVEGVDPLDLVLFLRSFFLPDLAKFFWRFLWKIGGDDAYPLPEGFGLFLLLISSLLDLEAYLKAFKSFNKELCLVLESLPDGLELLVV